MQISNPFTNPLFLPLMSAIATILAVGFVLILVAVKRKKEPLATSSLFIRWRTWACLAPLAVGFTLAGALPFTGWVMFIGSICVWEVGSVAGLSLRLRLAIIFLGACIIATALVAPVMMAASVVLSVLALAVIAMSESDGTGFDKAALAVLTVCYVSLLGAHAVLLSKVPGGDGLLLALITSSAVANVCAFTFGKIFGQGGKHKLAPLLSPNKTWEGAFGSVVGATLGFFALSQATGWLPLEAKLVIPVIVAIAGIAGDLFESLMKRSYGVKDAGNWLPGFGGAMDRVDGLLFVLPCVYYYLTFTGVI